MIRQVHHISHHDDLRFGHSSSFIIIRVVHSHIIFNQPSFVTDRRERGARTIEEDFARVSKLFRVVMEHRLGSFEDSSQLAAYVQSFIAHPSCGFSMQQSTTAAHIAWAELCGPWFRNLPIKMTWPRFWAGGRAEKTKVQYRTTAKLTAKFPTDELFLLHPNIWNNS
jgi:hypothetical protein